jgi:hypothetical protein
MTHRLGYSDDDWKKASIAIETVESEAFFKQWLSEESLLQKASAKDHIIFAGAFRAACQTEIYKLSGTPVLTLAQDTWWTTFCICMHMELFRQPDTLQYLVESIRTHYAAYRCIFLLTATALLRAVVVKNKFEGTVTDLLEACIPKFLSEDQRKKFRKLWTGAADPGETEETLLKDVRDFLIPPSSPQPLLILGPVSPTPTDKPMIPLVGGSKRDHDDHSGDSTTLTLTPPVTSVIPATPTTVPVPKEQIIPAPKKSGTEISEEEKEEDDAAAF